MIDDPRPPDIVFPFEQAENLRDELRRTANKLNEAINVRAQAAGRVDPFKGKVADDYRKSVGAHRDAMTATIERFRRLASTIDAAIKERRTAIQQRTRDQETWDTRQKSVRFR